MYYTGKLGLKLLVIGLLTMLTVGLFSSIAWAEENNISDVSKTASTDINVVDEGKNEPAISLSGTSCDAAISHPNGLALNTTQETTLTSGWSQCGTCEWMIDTAGVLTIRPLGNSKKGILEDWSSMPPWSDYSYRITRVEIMGSVQAPTLSNAFQGCHKLKEINGLSNLDVSKTKSMHSMFDNCQLIKRIDFPNWDSCVVTDMREMFSNCESLQSVSIVNVRTSDVVDMGGMFSSCVSLKELAWTRYSTRSVTKMDRMFKNCSALESLELHCNTSNVKWFYNMFSGCSSLVSLDMSTWDSNATTNKENMFQGCVSLRELKLGEQWCFYSDYYDVALPTPSGNTAEGVYTGLWVSVDHPDKGALTAKQLGSLRGSLAGTWEAETKVPSINVNKTSVSIDDQLYSGTALKPKLVVRNESTVLKEGIDYIVSYKNNISVGNAIAIVEGIGSYTGIKEVSFRILASDISNANVAIADQLYSGSPLKPKPSVKYDNRILKENTDYTITYKNVTSVGLGTVIVSGIGNYKGSKTATFRIVAASSGQNGSSNVPGNSTSSSANSSNTLTTTITDKQSAINSSNKNFLKNDQPQTCSTVSGVWKKVGGKWKFAYEAKTKVVQGKSCPVNEWVAIKGKRYHFDSKGYMHVKWQKLNNDWYWLGTDGAMKTGWVKTGGKWYYLDPTDGKMKTGLYQVGNTYYCSNGSGVMKTGWQKLDNQWYYFGSDGAMKTGWKKVKGNWYYLGVDGKMRTGSYAVGKTQYYSNSSGVMKTGWQKLNGKWYYFAKSGAMQTNKWISGKYWVGSNGVMATNAWVDNGRYYVDGSGKWVKNSSSKGSNASSISETLARNAIVNNWSNSSSMKPNTDFSHVVSIKNDGTFTYSKKYLKYPFSTTSVSGTWKYNGMSSGNYQYLLYRSGKLYGKARIENNGLVWIPNNATSGLYLKSGF